MFENLTLGARDTRQCGILRKSSGTRPALWLLEEHNIKAVVKDFSANGFLFRNVAGRFLLWREKKALTKLKGLTNVPSLYKVVDHSALVMEAVEGKTVGRLPAGTALPENFFLELRALVLAVHNLGIAHCDLKTSTNVLIDIDGHPHIVDWAASISQSEFRWGILQLIYRRFLRDDLMGVIKLQLRHDPDNVTPEDRERCLHRNMVERVVRKVRNGLRNTLKKVA
jgi:RIO-like serine/threonine protein kinase